MNVFRSRGEPGLLFVLLSDAEAESLREVLRKRKSPFARDLRHRLKKVLRV